MLNTIIIDDEVNNVRFLQSLIEQHCPSVKIQATFTRPEDGINGIKTYQPDLLFLDIMMPNMSGFDVLDKVKDSSFDVIFTTAYKEYALEALKHEAVDYLLKPIDYHELIQAINKLLNRQHKQPSLKKLIELYEDIKNTQE